MTIATQSQWQTVCKLSDLVEDSGVAVLIAGKQIALFYLPENEAVYAIDNYCPFSDANVIARGIVGDLKGLTVVASPLYKQHFCLNSGVCLEDDTVRLSVYPAQIDREDIRIAL